VPGVNKSDVSVAINEEARTLRVAACACSVREEDQTGAGGVTWHITERASGSGSRVLRIPNDVDIASIGPASVVDGVLQIRLPKQSQQAPAQQQKGGRFIDVQ